MTGQLLQLSMDKTGLTAMILSRRLGKVVIKESCRVEYAEPVAFDGSQSDDAAIAFLNEAMTEAAARIRLDRCRHAMVFIPSAWVSYRTLMLPFRSQKKIGQVLPMELAASLPEADTNHISDAVISRVPAPSTGYPVLAASVDERVMHNLFDCLRAYRITPQVVAPYAYAAAVTIIRNCREKDIPVVVIISEAEVTIIRMERNMPVMARTVAMACFEPDWIADKLKQTLTGFYQRMPIQSKGMAITATTRPEKDYQAVLNTLAEMEGIEPAPVQAFQSLALSAGLCRTNTGIDMLNFCQGAWGRAPVLKTQAANLAAAGLLALFWFGLVWAGLHHDIDKMNRQAAELRQQASAVFAATFPDKKSIGHPLLQMQSLMAAVRQKGPAAAEDALLPDRPDYPVIRVLYELSAQIGKQTDMDVSRLLLTHGRLTLAGSTDTFNTVDRIKNSLAASPIFKTVDIGSAAADKEGTRILFKFMIEL